MMLKQILIFTCALFLNASVKAATSCPLELSGSATYDLTCPAGPETADFTLTNNTNNTIRFTDDIVNGSVSGGTVTITGSNCGNNGLSAPPGTCTIEVTITPDCASIPSGETITIDAQLAVNPNTTQGDLFAPIHVEITNAVLLAYITNFGDGSDDGTGNISLCNVTGDVIDLAGCTYAGTTPSDLVLVGPAYTIVTVTPDGNKFAYTSNFACGNPSDCGSSQTITICPVNSDGSLGNTEVGCFSSSQTFINPNGIEANAAGSVLYITNGGVQDSPTVTACKIDAGSGQLNSCIISGNIGVPGSTAPNGIALNLNEQLAYIVNYTISDVGVSSVAICPISTVDGYSIDAALCSYDYAIGSSTTLLNNPDDISFNPDKTMVYITNDGDYSNTCNASGNIGPGPSITICGINTDNGLANCTNTTANCTDINNTLGAPAGLEITSTYAYISNDNFNGITVCPIISAGLFGTCTVDYGNVSYPFNSPNDVFIFQ